MNNKQICEAIFELIGKKVGKNRVKAIKVANGWKKKTGRKPPLINKRLPKPSFLALDDSPLWGLITQFIHDNYLRMGDKQIQTAVFKLTGKKIGGHRIIAIKDAKGWKRKRGPNGKGRAGQ